MDPARRIVVSTIRKARPADAKALSELAESTFRTAFAAMNSADRMTLHCRNSYGERVQAAEISDQGLTTLVAEERGRLIGYAQLRWDSPPGCVPADRPGEIRRLYVLEDWHGKGVAPALMDACIAEMRDRGSDAVWLGVWERNPRAIAFYLKHGFVEVGEHTFPLGGDPQRDVIMVKTLTPRPKI